MEPTKVIVKCPHCGSVLKITLRPDTENKSITCPTCQNCSPFSQFKKIEPQDDKTKYRDEPEKEPNQDLTLGKLIFPIEAFASFRLKVGKNIIGRKAQSSQADCQIPITDNRRVSREHLVIEVKKVDGRGFVHYASLYKPDVNKTTVNDVQLEYGDVIVLNHGDIIQLPDLTVKFEIPDGD